ncbi:hypothetical protein TNCV_577651 [Trichonephila clavipes]|nr:hypothetical protein TNCV_577651 [Trichonephila clavipes]
MGKALSPLTFTSSRIFGRHLAVYQFDVTVSCPSNLIALTNPIILKKTVCITFFTLHVVFSPLSGWDHCQRPISCFLDMLERQKRYGRSIIRYDFKNDVVSNHHLGI